VEGVPAAQACPTLERALEATFRDPSPRILDLGPFSGDTVVFLADRGARVSVEEFEPPPPTSPDDEAPRTEPIHVDHPDGEFDLILAWEWWDFVPKERAPEFGVELRRLLKDGGRLLLFSLNDSQPKSVPSPLHRYRVVDEKQVFRTLVPDSSRPRWFYPTREIERLLAPMSIQALHLHRNQMREFLANKP
jgi:SAM-dependent methyltransferase